jgi:FtsP/CotA-like multicopper oxidase with cupredoxin domain
MTLKFAAALLAALLAGNVSAHGVPKPKHGGWTDTGAETSFELVRTARAVVVYVEGHGKPVATDGGQAEILLGSETGKPLARLAPAGSNTLSGPTIAVKRGDRLFVRVTFRNGSTEVGEIVVP